ncbi:hypothetical protein XI01_04370 [Bradyrhizobium sp. CCBAU 21360]|nr:hypothetical protein [Bradyrhizobium sp. CCBAU 21360]
MAGFQVSLIHQSSDVIIGRVYPSEDQGSEIATIVLHPCFTFRNASIPILLKDRWPRIGHTRRTHEFLLLKFRKLAEQAIERGFVGHATPPLDP